MQYFEGRGYTTKVVVPLYRMKPNMSTDPDALERMHKSGKLVATPCKNLPGQRSSSYDDRFILELAERSEGAIISNDNYADLLEESVGKNRLSKHNAFSPGVAEPQIKNHFQSFL